MEELDHQGKRIDQVEFSYKAIGYSAIGFMLLIVIYLVTII